MLARAVYRRQDEESSSEETAIPTDTPGDTTSVEETSTPPPQEPSTTSSSSSTRPPTTSPPTSKPPTSSPPPTTSRPVSTSTPLDTNSPITTVSSEQPGASGSASGSVSVSTSSSSSSTLLPPAVPSGTSTVGLGNNFIPSSSDAGDVDQQTAIAGSEQTNTPAKDSGSSSVLPIVLPSLLIPIVILAVLVMLVRRRRRQHAAMVDDFTFRSTFYAGDEGAGAQEMTENLNRSPSLASSRFHGYQDAHRQGGGSHLDHTMPPMQHNQTFQTGSPMYPMAAVPPAPRMLHARAESDDLDIKCAGRTGSTASFGAIYDQYATPASTQTDGGNMQAYNHAPSAIPSMPDHPYSPTQAQFHQFHNSSEPQPQQSWYPQAAYQPSAQQQQHWYPQAAYQPPAQQQQQQPVYAVQSRNPFAAPSQQSGSFHRPQFSQQSTLDDATHPPRSSSSTPPKLDLPTFSFDFHDANAVSSPLTPVFKTDDPFADPGSSVSAHYMGSYGPVTSAFPSPPARVSAEKRAFRTKSIEQRLEMALADSQH